MGCTSAKPKRTTSIEDLAAKQPQNANQVPDKNGQVNKGPGAAAAGDKDKILREKDAKQTNAIEIPGAHKSFMAPDGIPFIDEDVESEVDDAAIDSRNTKHGSPDQNKNVTIVANKEVKLSAANPTATRSSALEEKKPVVEASRAGTGGGSHQPAVVSDIKLQEIQITTTKNQQSESTEVRTRTILTDNNKPKNEEEVAATKIQAGIRGYLDRKKVKAIRANMQHPNEESAQHHHSRPKVTEHVVEERVEWKSEDPHDPKLDAAATKIQANYKGYRTRKEVKVHSK